MHFSWAKPKYKNVKTESESNGRGEQVNLAKKNNVQQSHWSICLFHVYSCVCVRARSFTYQTTPTHTHTFKLWIIVDKSCDNFQLIFMTSRRSIRTDYEQIYFLCNTPSKEIQAIEIANPYSPPNMFLFVWRCHHFIQFSVSLFVHRYSFEWCDFFPVRLSEHITQYNHDRCEFIRNNSQRVLEKRFFVCSKNWIDNFTIYCLHWIRLTNTIDNEWKKRILVYFCCRMSEIETIHQIRLSRCHCFQLISSNRLKTRRDWEQFLSWESRV